MLRIALCDDELSARDTLRFQLEKILIENSEQVVYEFSSGETAVRWLSTHPGEIDVLFLDVEMKELNGMEAAKQIREFDPNLFLVFVTGYADYVFDGYQVNAIDYLLKPVAEKKLSEVMTRIRYFLASQKNETFTFHNNDGTYRFFEQEIDYLYSSKRLVILVSNGQEYPFYGKLDDVERRLHSDFIRIHQRYLVNPKKVTHIETSAVTIGEQKLPISRSMKEEATKRLALSMIGGTSLEH